MTALATIPLWQRPAPLSRDRKSELTREDVAGAAFAIAETENLPAVSVKRVAGRLGIPGVRLQQYLHDRADLLDIMVDSALGEFDVAAVDGQLPWDAQLEQLAHALRALVRRHPWLSGLLGLRPPTGPNGLQFTERSLRTMADAEVDIASAAQCVETVLIFVCGAVRPDALAASAAGGTPPAVVADYLAGQMSSGSFPLVGQLLDTSSPVDADEVFDLGLTCLLTGMAAALAHEKERRLALESLAQQ